MSFNEDNTIPNLANISEKCAKRVRAGLKN
jgi:hypothetical protein